MTTQLSVKRTDGQTAQVYQDRDGVWTMAVWSPSFDTYSAGAFMTFVSRGDAVRALQAFADVDDNIGL